MSLVGSKSSPGPKVFAVLLVLVVSILSAALAPMAQASKENRHGLPADIHVPDWAKGQHVQFFPWQTHKRPGHPTHPGKPGTGASGEQGLGSCGSGCGEPPLTYYGGPIQHSPHIYAIFWGSSWNEEPGLKVKTAVTEMYEGLSETAYLGILSQYFDETGRISSHVAVTTFTDTKNPLPSSIGINEIDEETGRAIAEHGLSHEFDNQFVILTGPGSKYSLSGYCAFHGYRVVDSTGIKVSRSWVPYEGDAPLSEHCPGGALAATSEAASHEFAESATDPEARSSRGWRSADDLYEVSDMCNYEPQQLPNGSYVTYQWDDFQGSCSIEDASPPHVLAFPEKPTAIGEHEATLHAKVYPESLETTVKFEYGLTTGYGSTSATTVVKPGENLASSESVARTVSGLELERTYHYRVVATNSTGTYVGPDQKLTTSRWLTQGGANINAKDVSCLTAESCVAVGYVLIKEGFSLFANPAAMRWNGSEWHEMTVPKPPGAVESELRSVSCGSAESCVAIGLGEGSANNLVSEVWNGSEWSSVNLAIAPGALNLTTAVSDVSCTSATYCIAVGSYATEAGGKKRHTLVERWDGTEWTVRESANAEGQNLNELSGVSCWGVGTCLMVGNSKKATTEGTAQPLVLGSSGGSWAPQAAPVAPGGSGKLTDVSCRNAVFCMTLGRDGGGAGFTASWNGSSWQSQQSGLVKGMRDVSCGAMNSCDIVGGFTESTSSEGLAYHWNGSTWIAEALSPAPGGGSFAIQSVSCLPTGTCEAVGDSLAEMLPSWWWNLPTFSLAAGSKGTGNGQLTNPWGIAVDPSGNVWVADTGNNRIEKFNSKGEYQCQIGAKGSGNGQFSTPLGVAADASGNVWVADMVNNRVQQISPECKYLSQFGKSGSADGQLSGPAGVALDPTGNVWVLDSGNYRIEKFNSKGEFLTQCGGFGSGSGQMGEETYGIATDPDGNVWVADVEHARLEKFSSNCEYLAAITQTSSGSPWPIAPYGLAIDPSGNLWAPSLANKAVAGLFPEGAYFARFGEAGSGNGQFGGPYGIASGADGTIWVVDRNNNRIEKWLAGATYPTETGRAASVKTNETKLTATINPEGRGTAYIFEYGTTPAYGSSIPSPSSEAIGSGTKPISVSQTLTGLKPGTTYYYRVRIGLEGTLPTEYHYGKARKFTTRDVEAKTAPTLSQATPYQAVPETTSNGTWTGEATSYAYQWRRCNSEGKECANISGATSSSYTPVEADVGKTLISRVTAIGPSGSTAVAFSSPSGKVVAIGTKTEYSPPAGSEPWGIAKGPDGNLWFTNVASSKVGKITTSGTVTEYALPASSEPRGIIAGPDGNLWFTEDATNKIGKITTSGTKTEYALPANTHPYEIAAGPDGNLWFTESSGSNPKIGKITTAGTVTEYALGAGTQPWAITAGPDGNLWFTERAKDAIGKITTAGTVTTFALPAGSDPNDITVGPDGNLWFANPSTSKVGKITTAGAITEYAAGSVAEFIATGPDGNLWFTSFPDKVSKITIAGTVSTYVLAESSLPGAIVAGPDNRMWLAGDKITAIVP